MAPIEIGDVRRAADRLDGVVNRTPVFTSRTLDDLTGASVWLKAECFQRTGSFKFRGAYHAIGALTPKDRSRGVVAFSSGNHAQGVALAAALHGATATIVMPRDAPPEKRAATESYGASIIEYDRYAEDREVVGEQVVERSGGVLIPPFDHPDVMAGQGTLALELLDDVGPLDTFVCPVGGGGLISGCATVAAAEGIRVIGIEPEAGDDARQSMARDEIVTIASPRTIADGQQTTSVGHLTFAVMRERVAEIITVSDEDLRAAMRFLFERLNVVVEPSGACGVAALLSRRLDVEGERVGVVLSGGNIGIERFCGVVDGAD